MLTLCWAAKGGSGTTVVVAAMGLSVEPPVLLVDLDGDLPSVYGLAESALPGVHDWVLSDATPNRLIDLAMPVAPGVSAVCAGLARAPADAERWHTLGVALGAHPSTVVVDAGTGPPPEPLVGAADRTLLVTRGVLPRAATRGSRSTRGRRVSCSSKSPAGRCVPATSKRRSTRRS